MKLAGPSGFGAAAVLLLASLIWIEPARGADDLPPPERRLLEAAPRILEYAREHGVQAMGVLKFRVKVGNRRASDAGGLNGALADRLTLALVLKNPVQSPIGIVSDASAVAAELDGANHLTPEGRAKLFEGRYPLAWGETTVTPDLFVTGAVLMADDMSRMTVSLQGISKSGELTEIVRFSAQPTVTDVIEVGGSFSRGSRPGLQNLPADATAPIQEAARILQGQETHPLVNAEAPFGLEIQYDGRVQKLEVREGQVFVPEPREKQRVTLIVRRRDSRDKRRLGVVVKVNGESTLYRERLSEPQCRLWILEPDQGQLTLAGFQSEAGTLETFRVLSRKESDAKKMDYGRDVGTFSLTVFAPLQSGRPTSPAALLDEEGEDFAILTNGTLPKQPPANLGALKQTLLAVSSRGQTSRGLVVAGDVQKSQVRTVTFERDPAPIFSATVSYYRP